MGYRESLRARAGIRLADVDLGATAEHEKKKDAADAIAADLEKLRALQYLFFACHERSLLICLQGLDASGKDGTIGHVFSGLNPQGARVHAFK